MRAFPATIALALLVAGCTGIVPTAQVDRDGFAPVMFEGAAFRETDIVTERGLTLHADVYLPDRPREPGAITRFPTVLVLSPYWGDGTNGQPLGSAPYDFLVQRLVPRGYAVVFGDLAGSGGSSGCWDMMGPVERASAVAMVEGIAAQPWSDGQVGMMGLSYDAMAALMAASDGAPHLTTIVVAAPLTHAYGGVLQNGVHYGGDWRTIALTYERASLAPPGTNVGRYHGWSDRLLGSGECAAENVAAIEDDAYAEYYVERDLRAAGAQVNASVLYFQGLRDASVKPDNFGAWFSAVPASKKVWVGAWQHQFPTAFNAGRDDMYLTIHRWLDHELKGIGNGIEREPRVDVQDDEGRWRHEDAWPPADAAPIVFELGSDGWLVASGAPAGPVAFGGALSPKLATFSSAPLASGMHVSGAPTLRLTLASDLPYGEIVARIFEGEDLVAQGALDVRYRNDLAHAEPAPRSATFDVVFSLYPTEHVVAQGSTLRLVLAAHDSTGWYDVGPGSSFQLMAGAGSTLTLPAIERDPRDIFLVSCGTTPRAEAPPCYLGLTDLGMVNDP